MVRIAAGSSAPERIFPEPDHEPEKQASKLYERMRNDDPWSAPDGEYPECIPPFLYQAYNRAHQRDENGVTVTSPPYDPRQL